MHYRLVQSAVLQSHVVRLSVYAVDGLWSRDHIGCKSWKLIARTISPTPSLVVAQRPSTYIPRGTWENFRETKNLTTKTLLVIFAIAQRSCLINVLLCINTEMQRWLATCTSFIHLGLYDDVSWETWSEDWRPCVVICQRRMAGHYGPSVKKTHLSCISLHTDCIRTHVVLQTASTVCVRTDDTYVCVTVWANRKAATEWTDWLSWS